MKYQSGDAELFYEEQGGGAPLVLLHPTPVNHRFWLPLAGMLSVRYRVLMPDLRGHGQSEAGDGPITIEKLGADIERLLDVAMCLMSCAPAYVALIAEAQVDAGVRRGLPAQLLLPKLLDRHTTGENGLRQLTRVLRNIRHKNTHVQPNVARSESVRIGGGAGAPNGIAHVRVSLYVLHAVIVHDAQLAVPKRIGHR